MTVDSCNARSEVDSAKDPFRVERLGLKGGADGDGANPQEPRCESGALV